MPNPTAAKITRRPLRASFDADSDLLTVCEYGTVPQPALASHIAGVSCWLSFLLRKPGGTVIGFVLDGLSEIDVDDHPASLWADPRFDVPVLGLTHASVAEIVLRARTTFAGVSTADVAARHAARRHARDGAPDEAEHALRLALGAGDIRAHLLLAGCLCAQGRYREAYDHARIFTQLAPRDSWGFAWLGRAALELGEEQEAMRALRHAVKLERRGSHRTPARSMLRALDLTDGDEP